MPPPSGPPPPFTEGCHRCGKPTDSLLPCPDCKLVLYCTAHHRTLDARKHLPLCFAYTSAYGTYIAERDKLRSFLAASRTGMIRGDSPRDPFAVLARAFHTVPETKPYLCARRDLAHAARDLGSRAGRDEQCTHYLEILRHDAPDAFGVRFHLPYLLLSLGRDQEFYDYARWWYLAYAYAATGGPNVEMPWMEKDGDVFEEMHINSPAVELWEDVDMLVSFMGLKMKLFLDLKALQGVTDAAVDRVPRGMVEAMRPHIPKSAIILGDKKMLHCEDHSGRIKVLRWQLRDLYRQIDELNEHFWTVFLEGRESAVRPSAQARYGLGSREEAVDVFGRCRGYFYALPGAVDAVKEIKKDVDEESAISDDESERGEPVGPPVKVEP
ncbi:zinc finger MYND domain-containing protein [Aspergillus mulundensis]|uniref:MYND-type domain-containing protein n=1 Tax=Aspergillus mulundensis TaxID=1810919 RepID=A0A3D8SCP2_9EURO|nr:hypothetical protein DSM5745_04436 [Aspergillus mulundensis]RDW84110.1 hypothetical protein DSM5745_04436 [Aspergillus mulundensis]